MDQGHRHVSGGKSFLKYLDELANQIIDFFLLPPPPLNPPPTMMKRQMPLPPFWIGGKTSAFSIPS